MSILGEKQSTVAHNYGIDSHLVIYVALNCKTLEGFAGVMQKYCPDRRGYIFSQVFIQLLESFDKNEDDTVDGATKKEKLMALLKNQISTTMSTKVIYKDMEECHSLPSIDEQLCKLRRFIDEKKVEELTLRNEGRLIVYCRKTLLEDRQCRRNRNYRFFLYPIYEDFF
ncbi:unnamed protein product [Adineta ricciae]|uniref:Uncharacterized protein n=1 Tax=Adineta ricciae TaxID=249248 RepID=A0A816B7E1_ADIRI|nr:unnamed protein product [Adineta ricciae]